MKWGVDVGGKRKQLERKGCKVLKVKNEENKNEEEEERIKETGKEEENENSGKEI